MGILDSFNRTESDPSIIKMREIAKNQPIINDPQMQDKFPLYNLNRAVLMNPYLGGILERGKLAKRSRTRNF